MNFLPKDEKFFDLFAEQAAILNQAAAKLHDAARGEGELQKHAEAIAELEKQADQKTRDIYTRLNRTFVTPMDPEDVSQVAAILETLMDGIEALAFRLCAYAIDPRPPRFAELTGKLREATEQVSQLFASMKEKELKEKDRLLENGANIRRLMSEVTVATRNAVVDLYKTETDPVRVMKVREIYDGLETTARQYRRFTDILQNVIAKNL